eukprot:scaffold17826_cov114-Isochrysis_galbana.AAC.1
MNLAPPFTPLALPITRHRPHRLQPDKLDLRLERLDVLRTAGECPAGADARHENVERAIRRPLPWTLDRSISGIEVLYTLNFA